MPALAPSLRGLSAKLTGGVSLLISTAVQYFQDTLSVSAFGGAPSLKEGGKIRKRDLNYNLSTRLHGMDDGFFNKDIDIDNFFCIVIVVRL